jgi:alkaline phosphatase D
VFDNHDGLSAPGDPQAPGALAAFAEHVPVRSDVAGRIHRSLRWGDTAEVFMTDQRSYRDPTLPESSLIGTSTDERPEILDPGRTMLGAQQRAWLFDGLASSTAQWKVIGSQLMFWPWRSFGRLPGQPRGAGVYLNMTQWDGYVAERLALLDHLETHDVRDTVLFSGDSHVFSAANVAPDVDDPQSVPRVAEFGTGSVTSNNADESNYPTDEYTRPLFEAVNPNHLRFFESEQHGYAWAELTPSGAEVELRSPRTILAPTSPTDVLARFRVPSGTQRVDRMA